MRTKRGVSGAGCKSLLARVTDSGVIRADNICDDLDKGIGYG